MQHNVLTLHRDLYDHGDSIPGGLLASPADGDRHRSGTSRSCGFEQAEREPAQASSIRHNLRRRAGGHARQRDRPPPPDAAIEEKAGRGRKPRAWTRPAAARDDFIADGVPPSNEGRGYRRIRCRCAHQLAVPIRTWPPAWPTPSLAEAPSAEDAEAERARPAPWQWPEPLGEFARAGKVVFVDERALASSLESRATALRARGIRRRRPRRAPLPRAGSATEQTPVRNDRRQQAFGPATRVVGGETALSRAARR